MVNEVFVENNGSDQFTAVKEGSDRLVTSNDSETTRKVEDSVDNSEPEKRTTTDSSLEKRDSSEEMRETMHHSSRVKPAIVVRETSIDTSTTLADNTESISLTQTDISEGFVDIEGVVVPLENKILNNNLLKSDVNSSNPSLMSDISSDCSDLEDIYLEAEDVHNKTDIAFAEDLNAPFVVRAAAPPTFEIDLNDTAGDKTEKDLVRSSNNHVVERNTPVTKPKPPQSSGSCSGYWGNPVVQQPAPVSNLTLRHVTTSRAHTDPFQNLEIGCFGFRGEDYYRNCTHIVAEARQREKLKDFKGAQEMLRAAVEILIAGVQHDPDPMRREGVRRRTAEYLQIAENFATKHRSQQQHKKPIIMTQEQVKNFKIISVKDCVLIVQSPKSGNIHVLKTLRKPLSSSITGQSLVVRCPFLVPLVKYCVAEDIVFLLLKRIQGQVLPEYVDRFKHSTPLPSTLNESTNKDSQPGSVPASIPSSSQIQGLVPRNLVRKWAAQMVVCLSSLHKQGLVYADLNPRNVLIDDFSNVCLTYITQLPGLHHRVSPQAVSEMFVAPEALTGLHAVTPAADWWSFGAILFYLMSGHTLAHYYPYQALRTTNIKITNEEHSGGSSLVAGLLKYHPAERLGAGVMGSEEIRSHVYFSSIKWESLEKQQALLGTEKTAS